MVTRFMLFLLCCPLCIMFCQSIAAANTGEDQTLSPYFFVRSTEEGVDALPLQGTRVDVVIAGVIADVKVTQAYQNTGAHPLEAIYVFPGSTRAAVYGMKMTIGERVQIAKIQERNAARATYQQAVKDGKSASLLEQHRPNVFQMHVANVMPGDRITVELSYTEFLKPTEGLYAFVYPTVVGPRYSNQRVHEVPTREHWVANPYLPEGTKPTYTFDMTITLNAGLPIQDITSTSHQVDMHYNGPTQATIRLKPSEQAGGNRDFILKYRLQGGHVETGLLLYEGDGPGTDAKENFFLLMMQPPQRVPAASMPPREYIFIVDVSGSMHGFPLEVSKQLLADLLRGLRPQDRFNILLFAGTSSLFAKRSLPATPANIRHGIHHITRQRGGGGTELLPALEHALRLPHDEHTSRTIVIATDGYVTVETEAFDIVRRNLNRANLFVFGIGTSVNRYLIDGLARAGQGEPFVVTKPHEASAVAARFRRYIETPVLTGITLDYEQFQTYDIEPLSVPDIFAERPVVVFGKWRGEASGSITLRGYRGEAVYTDTVDVGAVKPAPGNAALRYLWARHRIATLDDYNTAQADKDRIETITQLGLQYNLLTQYTSFVAVDDQVRNQTGGAKTVKQPLPLPKGVTNHAVGGGNVPTVPEPETNALLAVLGVFLLGSAYRKRQALRARWLRLRGGRERV